MKTIAVQPFTKPIIATVQVPGSKSYTNRALLIAALSPLPVKLNNPLFSDDTEAMLNCLKTLGLKVNKFWNAVEVVDSIAVVKDASYILDAQLSGTTIRFILALSTVIPGRQTLIGDKGLLERPIGDLVDALRQLGAKIEYLEREGYPPLRVNSSTLNSGTVMISGTTSSQYLSALLMISPIVGMTIHVKDELISKPYVDMTVITMMGFGISSILHDYKEFEVAANQTYVNNTTQTKIYYEVEGDVSSACYFWAIAALTKSTITVQNVRPKSKQADMNFLKILERMNSKIINGSDFEITVSGNGVKPLTVDMEDCPDQAMTMAILAAFANGTSTITGIASLRVKETERIKALETELAKMGIKTESTTDSLTIYGGQPKAAAIDTYGDHRIAMAFAVAGTKLPGMVINNPDVVNKTFPEFWEKLANISRPKSNIVIIGMRGSGKTTVAKKLADALKLRHIDLDTVMTERLRMSTPEIVETHGWDYFRNQESALAIEFSKVDNTVISTGGGIVLRPENTAALKKNGRVVLLRAASEILADRLADSTDRPPLTDAPDIQTELKQVAKERRELYETTADIVINTDNLTPDSVVEQIIAKLNP